MFVKSARTVGVPFIAPEEDWDYKEFLVLVLAVEHGMIIFKIMLEQVIDDTPFEIAQGQRERDALQENFHL